MEDVKTAISEAFKARVSGFQKREITLLRHAYELDKTKFWSIVQEIYKFKISIGEIAAIVDSVKPSVRSNKESLSQYNIICFPDYSLSNNYQIDLYSTVIESGGRVVMINDLKDLLSIQPVLSYKNILHIHWINAFFRNTDANIFFYRASYVMSLLKRLKSRGFEIFWTIHNYLSHEIIDRQNEIKFRRALYNLADRVYIHHPMIADLLDWLPDQNKLYLMEHGPYPVRLNPASKLKRLRKSLGLKRNDLVFIHIGQVREYSGLDRYVPIIEKLLNKNSNMIFVIAGRIRSTTVKALLNKVVSDRFIVKDNFLSKDELERWMFASDFGFLSYSSILTSGALFHWLSCGIPVIAPDIGTLPAYVVNEWNGFLYRDESELYEIIDNSFKMNSIERKKMAYNAKSTAESLSWNFP